MMVHSKSLKRCVYNITTVGTGKNEFPVNGVLLSDISPPEPDYDLHTVIELSLHPPPPDTGRDTLH